MTEKLNYFVPFLMYRVMARGLRQATNDYAKIGLSVPDARVLIVLHQHRGRIRAGALADVTCIEASALSHILRGLSRKGAITRERVHSDNRSVEVALTSHGRRLAEVSVRASKNHERTLLRRFSAEDRETLRRLLTQMHENAMEWVGNGDYLALKTSKIAGVSASGRSRSRKGAK